MGMDHKMVEPLMGCTQCEVVYKDVSALNRVLDLARDNQFGSKVFDKMIVRTTKSSFLSILQAPHSLHSNAHYSLQLLSSLVEGTGLSMFK